MAHSIEGRFPFLDCRLVEFCNGLPANLKLRGLTEKYLLKKIGRKWLPEEIWRRPKRPYRAPIHRCFFNHSTPDYVRDLLSPAAIQTSGLFKALAVDQLVKKVNKGLPVGETDDMALAGVLSTQLLHSKFIAHFRRADPLSARDAVKVCAGAQACSSARG
jgi:asparagine synthase (glutamine-hydrolysing)